MSDGLQKRGEENETYRRRPVARTMFLSALSMAVGKSGHQYKEFVTLGPHAEDEG